MFDDRAVGAFLGLALGDAFGRSLIRGLPRVRTGRAHPDDFMWTDDTHGPVPGRYARGSLGPQPIRSPKMRLAPPWVRRSCSGRTRSRQHRAGQHLSRGERCPHRGLAPLRDSRERRMRRGNAVAPLDSTRRRRPDQRCARAGGGHPCHPNAPASAIAACLLLRDLLDGADLNAAWVRRALDRLSSRSSTHPPWQAHCTPQCCSRATHPRVARRGRYSRRRWWLALTQRSGTGMWPPCAGPTPHASPSKSRTNRRRQRQRCLPHRDVSRGAARRARIPQTGSRRFPIGTRSSRPSQLLRHKRADRRSTPTAHRADQRDGSDPGRQLPSIPGFGRDASDLHSHRANTHPRRSVGPGTDLPADLHRLRENLGVDVLVSLVEDTELDGCRFRPSFPKPRPGHRSHSTSRGGWRHWRSGHQHTVRAAVSRPAAGADGLSLSWRARGAGTFAALALGELGWSAEPAMVTVRSVRPGAIGDRRRKTSSVNDGRSLTIPHAIDPTDYDGTAVHGSPPAVEPTRARCRRRARAHPSAR